MAEKENEREAGESSKDVLFKVPRETMIPSLLNLVRQEYVRGKRSGNSDDPEAVKKQMATEYAIEDAIFTWIDEMREEKAKKDMMEKIRRRFDARWNSL